MIISNQPYFYKKAELFPDSAFVIGADTAARLINVRIFFSFNRLWSADIMWYIYLKISLNIIDNHYREWPGRS